MTRLATAILAGTLLACTGGAGPTPPEDLVVVERTPLGPVPEHTDTLRVAPSLDSVAWAEQGPDGWRLFRDGNQVGGPYDALGQALRFDPTGALLAWSSRVGESWTVHVGDASFGPYRSVGTSGVVFTEDGAHWGFHAETVDGWVVVVDGAASPTYERSSAPVLGPGGHTAWLGQIDGQTQVVVDGEVRGAWASALLQGFAPDGSRFAWAAQDDRGWHLFVDGSEQPGTWEAAGNAVFSGDGADLAWVGKREGAWFVVHGAETFGPFEDVSPPVFGPEGELGWAAREGGEWRLRVGDRIGEPQDRIGAGSPQFGRRAFAWWSARGTRQTVWRDLVAVADVDVVAELGVSLHGPDDAVGFVARDGAGWYARLGAWESPRYARIAQMRVSDDGRHVALVAEDDRGWGVFVTDVADGTTRSLRGAEGSATDAGGGVRFVGPDRLAFTRAEAGRIERVVTDLR